MSHSCRATSSQDKNRYQQRTGNIASKDSNVYDSHAAVHRPLCPCQCHADGCSSPADSCHTSSGRTTTRHYTSHHSYQALPVPHVKRGGLPCSPQNKVSTQQVKTASRYLSGMPSPSRSGWPRGKGRHWACAISTKAPASVKQHRHIRHTSATAMHAAKRDTEPLTANLTPAGQSEQSSLPQRHRACRVLPGHVLETACFCSSWSILSPHATTHAAGGE